MVKRYLIPEQVDCEYQKMCKDYSYSTCTNCKNNKKLCDKVKKKHYFKMRW